MSKQKALEAILGQVDKKGSSSLGILMLGWNITHRKAINKLIKAGFELCANKGYISNGTFVVRKKPLCMYKNVFVIEAE